MPDDPLIPCPVRLPTSLVEQLREEARVADCTVSDVLRAHLTLANAKPLGKPRPQRRVKKLGEVTGADPVLLRQVAGIGNNLNQLARSVNAGLLTESPVDCVEILAVLASIEREISRVGRDHAH